MPARPYDKIGPVRVAHHKGQVKLVMGRRGLRDGDSVTGLSQSLAVGDRDGDLLGAARRPSVRKDLGQAIATARLFSEDILPNVSDGQCDRDRRHAGCESVRGVDQALRRAGDRHAQLQFRRRRGVFYRDRRRRREHADRSVCRHHRRIIAHLRIGMRHHRAAVSERNRAGRRAISKVPGVRDFAARGRTVNLEKRRGGQRRRVAQGCGAVVCRAEESKANG